MIKRAIDVIFSATGLVILFPVFLLVALAVKFDTPGPVLFRQSRVGRYGHPFEILKFRSMRHARGQDGPLITSGGDARVTRVGRLLRTSKLDELPQLINVLRGDMSLVGPRPEVPEYVELYPEADRDLVLSVRPGITDETSIEFRDEEQILAAADDPEVTYMREILPRKLDLYKSYALSNSISGDLLIILRTLSSVFRLSGKTAVVSGASHDSSATDPAERG